MADGGVEGERLRTAEWVASTLGQILEELLDDLRSWPRFMLTRKKRWVMEGKMMLGVRIFNDWQALLPGEEN